MKINENLLANSAEWLNGVRSRGSSTFGNRYFELVKKPTTNVISFSAEIEYTQFEPESISSIVRYRTIAGGAWMYTNIVSVPYRKGERMKWENTSLPANAMDIGIAVYVGDRDAETRGRIGKRKAEPGPEATLWIPANADLTQEAQSTLPTWGGVFKELSSF